MRGRIDLLPVCRFMGISRQTAATTVHSAPWDEISMEANQDTSSHPVTPSVTEPFPLHIPQHIKLFLVISKPPQLLKEKLKQFGCTPGIAKRQISCNAVSFLPNRTTHRCTNRESFCLSWDKYPKKAERLCAQLQNTKKETDQKRRIASARNIVRVTSYTLNRCL